MLQLAKAVGSAAVALAFVSTGAQAAIIATWTFESSIPATAGPFAPEVGAGQALGFHASTSTIYSNPVGNGSAESFSSDRWAVGDYYQFSVSTTGFTGVQLSWDQTSSNTGPRDFKLAYSTNGTTFTDFISYAVLANAAPNTVWNGTTANSLYTFANNLSSITALDNQSSIFFRLINTSTVSANGGVVATTGTDRVDNFSITATPAAPVPLPPSVWMMGAGLAAIAGVVRRRRKEA